MKFKTTQKAIKSCYLVVPVGYAELQDLLCYDSPIAYTTRIEGWGADIYDIGDGIAIATGYAPFGSAKIDYGIIRDIEQRAHKIRFDWHTSIDDQKEALNKLKEELKYRVRQAVL